MRAAFVTSWESIDFLFSRPHHYVFGAFKQTELIGFIAAISIEKEVEILTCAVTPKHQRKGIATRLFTTLMQLGTQRIFLDVDIQNTKAIGLYQKMGFAHTYTRRNYYLHADKSRSDAWTMSKQV